MTGMNTSHGKKILTRNERRRKRTNTFFMFALVLIAVCFLLFMYLNFFNVKKIEVAGIENGEYTEDEIIEFVGISEGDNLINVRSRKLEEAVEKRFAYVQRADIKKVFPSGVRIELTMYTPEMAIKLGEDVFLLSYEAKVLDSVPVDDKLPENVTLINTAFVKECIVGERLVLDDVSGVDVLCEFYQAFLDNSLHDELTSLDITNKFDVRAKYDDRFDLTFGTYEDVDAKVSLLASIMKGDLWTDASGVIDLSDSREAAVRLTGSAAN